MKIVVCMKPVPSSEARINIASDGRSIDPTDVEMVANPYDEYAVEEALRIKEARGEGEVIVLTVAAEAARSEIRKCLAMGVDRGVIVQDPALLGGDGIGTARVLAAVIRELEPELVLCGKLSIDVESDVVGIALAEYLDWPHVSLATKIEWPDGKMAKVQREIEGGAEIVEVSLPAVVTAEKGLNEPRYASLKGIMAAKRKPIEAVTPSVDAGQVGAAGAGVEIVAMNPPPARGGGKKFEGEIEEVVPQVVELLKSEAKIL
ncbi:MAG: electron transfer flavoprotein subunit beta/FixA family protein [Candidatus Eisenbacteria sp.]|nr:electron transfer flavoprotein subunit beta/FixA family protein [Candidatus Eisenbacteria bacterium]